MVDQTLTLDATQLAALATFGARFNAYADLQDPLLAIVECANLKGRLAVLQQLGVFGPADAAKTRQLLDLLLAGILDTFLDGGYDIAPVRGIVATLRQHVEDFGRG